MSGNWFTERTCERVAFQPEELGGSLEFCTTSIDWLTVGLVAIAGWFVMHLLLNVLLPLRKEP